MSQAWQTLIVVLLVAGAAGFVLWRVLRPWFVTPAKPGCPSCAAGNPCADNPKADDKSANVHPLVLVKTKTH